MVLHSQIKDSQGITFDIIVDAEHLIGNKPADNLTVALQTSVCSVHNLLEFNVSTLCALSVDQCASLTHLKHMETVCLDES
jgi:hypothetical protein